MGAFETFPYTNFQNLNLNWIIKIVKEYVSKVDTLDIDFKDLKNYVISYFDNLDIQEEVNNKLDEMAESGELADIIAQYLELQSLICFNDKSSMKEADNLVNGSSVITLGTSSYNDGETKLYKIRTLTSSDVIDDVNIIALTNYPTLIAEWLINTSDEEYTVIISDSYANDTTRDGEFVTGWASRFKNIMGFTEGTNIFTNWDGGAGFIGVGGQGYAFPDMLSNLANTMTKAQRDLVTKILVCGGANDISQGSSSSQADYTSAVTNLSNNAKTYYPNALVMIIPIGFRGSTRGYRRSIARIYQYTKNACKQLSNVIFCDGAYLPLYNSNNMCEDSTHPNNNGQELITGNIINAFNGSINSTYFEKATLTITPDSRFTSTTPLEAEVILQNNVFSINWHLINQQFQLATPETITFNTSSKLIGTYLSNLLPDNANVYMPCHARVKESGGQYHTLDAVLQFNNGNLYLYGIDLDESTSWKSYTIDRYQIDCDYYTTLLGNI